MLASAGAAVEEETIGSYHRIVSSQHLNNMIQSSLLFSEASDWISIKIHCACYHAGGFIIVTVSWSPEDPEAPFCTTLTLPVLTWPAVFLVGYYTCRKLGRNAK